MAVNLQTALRAMALVAICSAIVSCVTFLVHSRLLTHTNFVRYCIVLALSDLSISLCFVSNYSGLGATFDSDLYQQAVATYIMVFGLFSLNIQALIAVERFFSARIRAVARRPYKLKKFIATIVCGALLPAAFNTGMMIAVMYPEKTFELDSTTLHFGINWDPTSVRGISMIVMLLLLQYLLPFIVIAGCYGTIIFLHNRRAVMYGSPVMAKKVRRINIMCLVSSLAFVLAWTPYAACGFIDLLQVTEIGKIWWLVANTCGKTCTVYNAVLFWVSTRQLEANATPTITTNHPGPTSVAPSNFKTAGNNGAGQNGHTNVGLTVSNASNRPSADTEPNGTNQHNNFRLKSPASRRASNPDDNSARNENSPRPAGNDEVDRNGHVYAGPYSTAVM